MGIFGKNDKVKSSDYAYATQPGAVPVATPVPEVQAYQQQQQQQKMSKKAAAAVPVVPQAHVQAAQPVTSYQHSDIGMGAPLSRSPMLMKQCPNCARESRTRIKTYPAWQTWGAAAGLVLCFWPVAWAPLVLDNCKQTDHFCVLCGSKVGQVNAFQDCCVTTKG